MSIHAQTVRLEETSCPHCRLITRADYEQCLHCRKPLRAKEKSRAVARPAHAEPARAGPPGPVVRFRMKPACRLSPSMPDDAQPLSTIISGQPAVIVSATPPPLSAGSRLPTATA
jgi:hypothetical protein